MIRPADLEGMYRAGGCNGYRQSRLQGLDDRLEITVAVLGGLRFPLVSYVEGMCGRTKLSIRSGGGLATCG
jgi:hypothetical protein